MYICGDCNIDLLKIGSNIDYCSFYENVLSSSFAPKITLPTRMCDTASTLIDYVFSNITDKDHTCGKLVRPISDHQIPDLSVVACQRYLCPNVISMTMNVFIFRNLSLKIVFIEPYVKINYSLSLSLSLSMYFCILNENYIKHITKQTFGEIEESSQEALTRFKTEIKNSESYDKLQKTCLQIQTTIIKFYWRF